MGKRYNLSEAAFIIGSFAVEAMLYELMTFPSPGLVSPVSNGAHKDMNIYTFIESTVVLDKYMTLFAEEGLKASQPKELFYKIREIGIEAEKAMFEKTKGVNTHKGMLFLMGISSAAAAYVISRQMEFAQIPTAIKEMTSGIIKEELESVNSSRTLSHGEMIFMKYGIAGVRKEAELGLPTVFLHGLPMYRQCKELSENDRLIHTLLTIMQSAEDSTIVYRHSVEVLYEVQKKAEYILGIGGMSTPEGRSALEALDIEFIQRGISPGGCADLLAVTVFFHRVEAYMKNS